MGGIRSTSAAVGIACSSRVRRILATVSLVVVILAVPAAVLTSSPGDAWAANPTAQASIADGAAGCAQTPNPSQTCGTGQGFCATVTASGAPLSSAAEYDDVYACGPEPGNGTPGYGSPNQGSEPNFFESSPNGFQCTELANRVLWDVWGIMPISGESLDGKNFAATVASTRTMPSGASIPLVKNGTQNEPYLPGDIVSFTGDGGLGHVAVVTSSNYTDATGDGTVTLLEENSPVDTGGVVQVSVKHWALQSPPESDVTPSYFDAFPHWQVQSFPNPADNTTAWPRAVSCTSSTFCEAVGGYQAANGDFAVFDEWTGSAWVLQSQPAPADSQILGVSCVSATFCEAVGNKFTGTSYKTLAELWNGKTWAIQATPNPVKSQTESLTSVSCTATNLCEALGWYETEAGNYYNVAEVWTGAKWAKQSITGSSDGGTSSGVSCTSSSFCYGLSGQEALRWDGTKWSQLATGPTDGSVSCVSSDFCEFVNGGSAESWNGKKSTVQPLPGSATLSGVSCITSAFCEAVGYDDGAPVGENWNGTTWAIQPTPDVTNGVDSNLQDVSCTANNFCEAVGAQAETSSNPQVVVAEEYGL